MSGTRRVWKEYILNNADSYRALQSAWQSSISAFPGKRMYFQGIGLVITNMSERGMRELARSVDVTLPDYVTGTDPEAPEPEDDGLAALLDDRNWKE